MVSILTGKGWSDAHVLMASQSVTFKKVVLCHVQEKDFFQISADLDIQLGTVALRECVCIFYCNLYSNFC